MSRKVTLVREAAVLHHDEDPVSVIATAPGHRRGPVRLDAVRGRLRVSFPT
jgi:hypothetical protein